MELSNLRPGLSSEALLALIKRKLVDWESQFLAEHGREPGKSDAYEDAKMGEHEESHVACRCSNVLH